jgi:hypothetical protein
VCVCGPSCLLGSVHRRYSVVVMSRFLSQCGCGSSSLWVLLYLRVCMQTLVSWGGCLILMRVPRSVLLLTYWSAAFYVWLSFFLSVFIAALFQVCGEPFISALILKSMHLHHHVCHSTAPCSVSTVPTNYCDPEVDSTSNRNE